MRFWDAENRRQKESDDNSFSFERVVTLFLLRFLCFTVQICHIYITRKNMEIAAISTSFLHWVAGKKKIELYLLFNATFSLAIVLRRSCISSFFTPALWIVSVIFCNAALASICFWANNRSWWPASACSWATRSRASDNLLTPVWIIDKRLENEIHSTLITRDIVPGSVAAVQKCHPSFYCICWKKFEWTKRNVVGISTNRPNFDKYE